MASQDRGNAVRGVVAAALQAALAVPRAAGPLGRQFAVLPRKEKVAEAGDLASLWITGVTPLHTLTVDCNGGPPFKNQKILVYPGSDWNCGRGWQDGPQIITHPQWLTKRGSGMRHKPSNWRLFSRWVCDCKKKQCNQQLEAVSGVIAAPWWGGSNDWTFKGIKFRNYLPQSPWFIIFSFLRFFFWWVGIQSNLRRMGFQRVTWQSLSHEQRIWCGQMCWHSYHRSIKRADSIDKARKGWNMSQSWRLTLNNHWTSWNGSMVIKSKKFWFPIVFKTCPFPGNSACASIAALEVPRRLWSKSMPWHMLQAKSGPWFRLTSSLALNMFRAGFSATNQILDGYIISYNWLVVVSKIFIFHFIYGMSSQPHWRTHIFQDGYCTTNQIYNILVYPIDSWWLYHIS